MGCDIEAEPTGLETIPVAAPNGLARLGRPSLHTTIAFAMAVMLFRLFPKQRWLGCAAITYAL